jgi:hypothetical protein
MPISDDDLNYLRNINTSPGPNAGKSIDPTKPGPDADRVIADATIPSHVSGLIEAAEWPFGYQDTFSLISDATRLVGGHIWISVSKFEKAYNKLRTRAADRSEE